MKNKSGVQEWAQHSLNLQYTCEYSCRYCYAKKLNNRFHFKVKEPVIKHYNGIVMFPIMHDITLYNFDKVADTIEKLLEFDNKILIVSKMRLCIANKFFSRFASHDKKNNLEFRITINYLNADVKEYFEALAPALSERISSLRHLSSFLNTSISIEPLLDNRVLKEFVSYESWNELVRKITPLKIWVGCLTNYKLNPDIPEEKAVIDLYRTLPEIYEKYKEYNSIKFKDSFFKAMNRELKRREKTK